MANYRKCGFCGSNVTVHQTKCPYCYRDLKVARAGGGTESSGGGKMFRKGLYYVILAGGVYAIVMDKTPLHLTFTMPEIVTNFVLPGVVLLGVVLMFVGIIRALTG
jgi:hypothetical protein